MSIKGGGGGQTHTVTQQGASEPWRPQQPYLQDAMGQAQALYQVGAGEPVGMSSTTRGGINAINRAARDDSLIRGAQRNLEGMTSGAGWDALTRDASGRGPTAMSGAGWDALQAEARGDNIGANPYLSGMWDGIAGDISGRAMGGASASGRLGSGAATRQMIEGLGRAATDFYGSQYQADRGRQMQAAQAMPQIQLQEQQRRMQSAQAMPQIQAQAAGMAPGLDAARYMGGQQQIAAGQLGEDYDQQSNNWAWDNLARYSQLIQGNYGGTSTQQQSSPIYRNPVGGAIGGGMAGYQIGGPIGGMVGAGLGLLA